jgi:autotransporter-associated beta strand protein
LTIQSGTGTTTLNITQSGNIDDAGTLTLAGPISITAGKTATFTGAGTTTVSGNIANTTGAITIGGTKVIFTGTNSYSGLTTINSSYTLQIGNAGTSGTLGSNASVVDNGTLTFDRTDTYGGAISQVISGSGAVTELGGGTLTLSAANTFTGTTTLTSGTLDLTNQYALQNSVLSQAASTTLIFDSTVSANAFSFGGLSGVHDITLQNGATQAGSAIVLTLGNNTITNAAFTGSLKGTGSLVKVGANTQTLSGTGSDLYSFSGTTSINGGILEYQNTYALSSSSAVTVNPFGTMAIAVGTSAGLFTSGTTGAGTIGGTFSGAAFNNGSFFGIDTTSVSTSYAGAISGTGVGLNKLGTNTLTLTGTNTYTGPTIVTAGTLTISTGGSLGSSGTYAGSIYDLGTLNVNVTQKLSPTWVPPPRSRCRGSTPTPVAPRSIQATSSTFRTPWRSRTAA